MLRNFTKISIIAFGIQIIGYVFTYFFDEFIVKENSSTIAPVYILLGSTILSMIIGIFLALKWCDSKFKLITILLLPTNYIWLLVMFMIIEFVKAILLIIENIPDNYG